MKYTRIIKAIDYLRSLKALDEIGVVEGMCVIPASDDWQKAFNELEEAKKELKGKVEV